ncbi:hypothetical protein LAZ67_X000880 [Cordylochernes scorpioides]|uniref:Uncharacterized protein n=1 Tax=Cordylochernes scorpioides TaxID=51811 RepID=A0ABY6LS02_9ARAC|nr:hypothetical protein LAZ67_X000880 [Cordylochernes scorpioides]
MFDREWEAIPQDTISILIELVPRRVVACIAACEHFDPNKERWEDWLQQYSQYETAMEMKKKESEVQVASFIRIIGSDALKNYHTFVLSPEETKKVEEIKKRFTN